MAVSVSLVIQAPLIADYLHNSSKGIGTGILALSIMIGSMMGEGLIQIMIKAMKLAYIYGFFAIGLGMISVIALFAIRGGRYHLLPPSVLPQSEALEPVIQPTLEKDLSSGMKAILNPWMIIIFILTLQAGVAGPLGSSIYILWVQSFYGENQHDRAEAVIRVANLTMSLQFAAFIGFIFSTLAIDKFSRFTFLVPPLLLSLCAYAAQIILQNPDSLIMNLIQVMQGFAGSALAISSTYIFNRYTPAAHRGKILAIIGVSQMLGSTITLAVGGYLFHQSKNLSLIHISEPTRQAEISYAVFCLKKKNIKIE
eukprot:TRINITY_DN5166_c0_g2_i2.p1 TRINITY_DN5166_c0_g2~~TRINITY_DN5166_c0_g2_i2.p1  ORF type:complete len:311 (+),score=34.15 TRINITY_DN5166_c0_g2_i2:206-1138(+)